jgi:hypothetical protein
MPTVLLTNRPPNHESERVFGLGSGARPDPGGLGTLPEFWCSDRERGESGPADNAYALTRRPDPRESGREFSCLGRAPGPESHCWPCPLRRTLSEQRARIGLAERWKAVPGLEIRQHAEGFGPRRFE